MPEFNEGTKIETCKQSNYLGEINNPPKIQKNRILCVLFPISKIRKFCFVGK